MKNYIINVVSYKRPNNSTCNLLNETNLNWRVFVYKFDKFLNEYKQNYKEHVYVIDSIEKPNLSYKRQLTLDKSIEEKYKYCFMLDDDIKSIETLKQKNVSIKYALSKLYKFMIKNQHFVAVSASFDTPRNNDKFEEYKCICNNSIFNLELYNTSGIKYNIESKCEDMEFTVELLLNHFKCCRLNTIIMRDILQSGLTGDGLAYRFNNTKRFIEEGSYICKKYPELKDAFEYDEYHFKLKSNVLKILLQEKFIKELEE